MMGSGGKDVFFYTKKDAISACEKALGKTTFRVTVPPGHTFVFESGERVCAEQWISSDSVFSNDTLIAHITMTICELRLHRQTGDLFHAFLRIENLHYTVRKKADSDWISKNIVAVLNAQSKGGKGKGKGIPAAPENPLERYNQIQATSMHRGLNNSSWNSGNKDQNEAAKVALNYANTFQLWPGDLDKVKGMIMSVGGEAMKMQTFTHKQGKKLVTSGATVTFDRDLSDVIDQWKIAK
jgi:hypothetical protein